jgi:hypothetical protein
MESGGKLSDWCAIVVGSWRDSTLNYATTASFRVHFNSLFTINQLLDAVWYNIIDSVLSKVPGGI